MRRILALRREELRNKVYKKFYLNSMSQEPKKNESSYKKGDREANDLTFCCRIEINPNLPFKFFEVTEDGNKMEDPQPRIDIFTNLQISKLLYRLGDNKLIGSFPVSGSPQILKLLNSLVKITLGGKIGRYYLEIEEYKMPSFDTSFFKMKIWNGKLDEDSMKC